MLISISSAVNSLLQSDSYTMNCYIKFDSITVTCMAHLNYFFTINSLSQRDSYSMNCNTKFDSITVTSVAHLNYFSPSILCCKLVPAPYISSLALFLHHAFPLKLIRYIILPPSHVFALGVCALPGCYLRHPLHNIHSCLQCACAATDDRGMKI